MGQPRRELRDDEGFTLVELVVVLGILAILIVQSFTTFVGLRERANNRRAESNVRNAFAAARIYYNVDVSYTGDPTLMETVEPAFVWQDAPLAPADDDTAIYVAAYDSGQTLVLAGRTDERCFFLRDAATGPPSGLYYSYNSSGACIEPDVSLYGDSWSD